MTDPGQGGHVQAVPTASNSGPSVVSVPSAGVLERRLTELFRLHHAFVWRSLRRLGLDELAAEDGVQEVFCVVQRRLAEFKDAGSIRAWLFAIARRVASHQRRAHGRREARLRQVAPAPAGGSPEETLARREAAQLVVRALERMDEPHRNVLNLAELEEMSAPEIALALELPLNTVYSRLRNGRRKFQRLLQAVVREPPTPE